MVSDGDNYAPYALNKKESRLKLVYWTKTPVIISAVNNNTALMFINVNDDTLFY